MPSSHVSRRSIAKGAAWALPAVSISSLAPALATSPTGDCPQTWHAESEIRFGEYYYSTRYFLESVNLTELSPKNAGMMNGNFEMQHWYNPNTRKIYWRLIIGLPMGAHQGATITFPIDPSWQNAEFEHQKGLQDPEGFARFKPWAAGAYTTNLSTAEVTVDNAAGTISVTFPEEIPAGGAGLLRFRADPTVGVDVLEQGGTVQSAGAAMKFEPLFCEVTNPPVEDPKCDPATINADSRIVYTDPNYSITNFDVMQTLSMTPPADFQMQHWWNPNTHKVYWRLAVGMPQGAEAGAQIFIPFDAGYNWTSPSALEQLSLARFKQHMPSVADQYSLELPSATVSTTDGGFLVTFVTAIPTGAAGMFEFNALPNGGDAAVEAGETYRSTAQMTYIPAVCTKPVPPVEPTPVEPDPSAGTGGSTDAPAEPAGSDGGQG